MNDSEKIRVVITSPPDKENLVAELWVGEHLMAAIDTEDNYVAINIYKLEGKDPWRLPLEVFEDALIEIKSRLLNK